MSDDAELTSSGPVGTVLDAVDRAVEHRWDAAKRRTAGLEGSPSERVEVLTRRFAREVAAVGAVTGGTSAVPGVGTVASLSTTAADLGWFTARAGDLILSIAAAYGHTEARVEERRLWLLAVLAFGRSADKNVSMLAKEAGIGGLAGQAIPSEILRRINRSIARRLIARYGTSRGAVALGRALPFGFGAAIGGGGNYVLIRAIARQAERFFRDGDEANGRLRFTLDE
ncbi:EcsC family protein [Actinospongicola halichondriae]|uniref:EcsC family protein n=1 Tax=Actinospongicola halichondriae TaxID=3236844 RepID=UPI003D3F6EB1